MENNLTQMKCVPCEIGTLPLTDAQASELLLSLPGWNLSHSHLERTFAFKDFKEALDFTNKVGELAEKEGHHPDIGLTWGEVKITLFTHKIKGLSMNDFILASKINKI